MGVTNSSFPNMSFQLAVIIVLADLATVLEQTALNGTSSYLDALFLIPGLHKQQNASNLNGGELPAACAMTTGYVFRIENQAMVFWLQRVSLTGHLADVRVEPINPASPGIFISKRIGRAISRLLTLSSVLYAAGIVSTITCFAVLVSINDYWAIGILTMLVTARLINVVVIRRRTVVGWKGIKEPGEKGDLLILLSQDRWVRMRGMVDDIKLVTSGQWVRELKQIENYFIATATLMTYGAIALSPNASTFGGLLVGGLLVLSAAFLGLCNSATRDLCMFNCRTYQHSPHKAYVRRRHMAEEMIDEHGGRKDWAVRMGLVLPESNEKSSEVIM